MEIVSTSAEDTLNLGRRLAKTLKGGEIIELNGQMGSGKTVIAKGFADGLGFRGAVTSPTFSIMNIYDGDLALVHCDCYRLEQNELYGSGIEEYLGDPNFVCLIEWAQKIEPLLRSFSRKKIDFEWVSESVRRITLIGFDMGER